MLAKKIWIFRFLTVFILVIGVATLSHTQVFAQSSENTGLVLKLNGELTQTQVDYLSRGLALAKQEKDELVIIEIDTPGGSIGLMQSMIEEIQASPIPVVVYVTPNGAMAGSAGSLITLAGNVVAMSPGTIIGAASPVDASGQNLGTTEQSKVTNAMVALAQSLTVNRPPAAQALAADMIQTAKAVSAENAKQIGLADIIAANQDDLLVQLNGYLVTTSTGVHTLETTNISVRPYSISIVDQALAVVLDPNILFILLTVGSLAILIELANPTGWIAGFVGVVCLALSIYGLGYISVNWVGLIFVLVAFVLFIVDIKAATHGALTAVGVITFIIGALVLFNSVTVPSTSHVSVPLVIGTGVIMGALFFTIVGIAVRARLRPVRTGKLPEIGRTGVAHSDIDPRGSVQIGGELWTAELEPDEPTIPQGAEVVITAIKGLHLKVKRAS